MTGWRPSVRLAGGLSVWLILAPSGSAQDSPTPQAPETRQVREAAKSSDLTDLSLEQLLSIEVKVTSASRKAEQLAASPAAIFVLTGEDIRRGGFSSLPEALRMVPGLYVAKVNSHWWTISARGFNDYLNNKMLVLINGRSVYAPQFGGVFWELQDLPVDEIDRIEVIRGPGGTLWGANAVNGVINIVSKRSAETQGLLAQMSARNEDGYSAGLRYGGSIGKNLTYRAFGEAEYSEPGVGPASGNAYDAWNLSQGGIRLDTRLSTADTLSLEAGMYEGRLHSGIPFFQGPGAPQTLLLSSYLVRAAMYSRGSSIASLRHPRVPFWVTVTGQTASTWWMTFGTLAIWKPSMTSRSGGGTRLPGGRISTQPPERSTKISRFAALPRHSGPSMPGYLRNTNSPSFRIV